MAKYPIVTPVPVNSQYHFVRFVRWAPKFLLNDDECLENELTALPRREIKFNKFLPDIFTQYLQCANWDNYDQAEHLLKSYSLEVHWSNICIQFL